MNLLNEQGILNLDEMVTSNPSWQKIMADGIVTSEELAEQANSVVAMFRKIDDTFSDEQKQLVQSLLAEASVLFAAHHVYQLQELTNK